MAALVQGVQYGLSSQGNVCDNNKSLIFVKLTDSAYRAIEDFLKNKNKFNKPTIQFLGDEGTITIPTCEPSHGQSRFQFSLSSSADIEGPQGSFECVHQNGPRSLESLGTLPCKMRIHAKEDVYETTRSRMAMVEEINKQSCTREIKPGGIGFGKKAHISRSPTGRNSLSLPQRREHDLPNLNSSNTAPANKQIPSNMKPSMNGYVSSHHTVINGSANSIHSRPLNNGHSQRTGNPDIMRRPIRERLVHLLAVRPYKRPELYDRIIKDGLRERDKKCLGDVLKQIAIMRENTYHLIRHIWNDVQEDWPFYSEQEKQLLKRRKPQNLTPPGSSDGGSSGSGQSPTSTHPGSPPPPVASGLKRPGYSEGSDGLLTKKPRISHYRKPDPPQPTYRETSNGSVTSTFRFPSSSENEENDGKRSVIENVGSNSVGSVVLNKDKLTRYDNVQKTNISYPYQSVVSNTSNCGNTSCNSTLSSSSNNINNNKTSREETPWPKSNKGVLGPSPSSRSHGGHHDNRNGRCHDSNGNSSSPLNRISTSSVQKPEQSSANHCSSPNSQSENLDQTEADSSDERDVPSTFPDYLTSYTTILNSEQRSKYKADFNADYSEYRRLHADVERVSQRFAFLEQSLKREERHSPAWKNIQKQIVKEYEENKRDHRHQEIKRRFQYLHDKLSHIKRLVLEYDSAPTGDHY